MVAGVLVLVTLDCRSLNDVIEIAAGVTVSWKLAELPL